MGFEGITKIITKLMDADILNPDEYIINCVYRNIDEENISEAINSYLTFYYRRNIEDFTNFGLYRLRSVLQDLYDYNKDLRENINKWEPLISKFLNEGSYARN